MYHSNVTTLYHLVQLYVYRILTASTRITVENLKNNRMIPFEEALKIVLDTNVIMTRESVDLHQSLGRILGKDITSDINMPPFNKSAMDGFAIRESDINNELTIIETIAAGQTPKETVNHGQASRIMTGAPIPNGADFVIQVELSELVGDNKVRFTGHSKNNIIPLAQDVKIGDIVLTKGQKIDARHIAVMASVGCHKPMGFKRPIVGIISTGDEIVEPETIPNSSQIRNSNGHQLIAQVLQSNAIPKYFGIISDSYEDIYNNIKKALKTCDILLLTGGVSMGDFDFVPKVMADLGVTILFNRVAVQPGKPTTFGRAKDKFIFGLPGYPVSAFVQFETLSKPLINKITGQKYNAETIKLPLANSYKRKKSARKAFIPVNINKDNSINIAEYHGSAHIYSLPNADGLAIIEEGVSELKEGDLVNVRFL